MDPIVGTLEELVRTLRQNRDWLTEVTVLSDLIDKLDKAGKDTTVRGLAKITNRSRSWIGVSCLLIKGLKTYPEIKDCDTRNEAYVYLQRKQKLRRFLES